MRRRCGCREELGLMREARPYIFEDVVNTMEQRLTAFQAAGVNNVVARQKTEAKAPAGGGHESGGPGLETIAEAPPPPGDRAEGKLEREARAHAAEHGTNIYLDNYGIMISLPDPVKVGAGWGGNGLADKRQGLRALDGY